MARLKIKYIVLACIVMIVACTHPPGEVDTSASGYPPEVAKIVLNKCAVTGCHNNKSYEAAGRLNMTTWNKLFEGGSIGSAVIPYRPDFSTMCYYTNTDTSLGQTLLPTMPVNESPLSKEEYLVLYNWILSGAPDVNGTIKFADDPERSKVYVANQLCDVITVFDTKTLLQMRYVDAGNKTDLEFPYVVKVSPDRQHWYVSFFIYTDIIQKFSAVDDRLIGELNLGEGAWQSFCITQDSKYGYFLDKSSPGRIACADLQNLQLLATYTFNDSLQYPVGVALNEQEHKLYIGNFTGNYISVIDIADPMKPALKQVPIDGSHTIDHGYSLNPVELLKDPNSNKCFIACQGTKEVRVMDMEHDQLLGTIQLGTAPGFMSISRRTNRIFITCPDDVQTFPGQRGAVVVANLNDYSIIKRVYSGYQPYGISVDDKMNVAAVVNANISVKGPEPHHTSDCGGRNGNITFIDLQTLELVPVNASEVANYPFGVAAR